MDKQEAKRLLAKLDRGEDLTLEEKVESMGSALSLVIKELNEAKLHIQVNSFTIVDLAIRLGMEEADFKEMMSINVNLAIAKATEEDPTSVVDLALVKARGNA